MKKLLYLMPLCLVIYSFTGQHTQRLTKPKIKAKMDTTYYIEMKTTLGDIKLKLYNETPLHRDNFIALAKKNFFDSLLFHRVISNFMIQGGDPNSRTARAGEMLGNGDVGYTIPAEFNSNLIHKKGALAAARTENPLKASSGCQFYIVQGKKIDSAQLVNNFQPRIGWKYTPEQIKTYQTEGGTPFLDNGYTVYGETIEGLDIIDKIAAVQKGPNDRPVSNVYILSTKVIIKTTKVKP